MPLAACIPQHNGWALNAGPKGLVSARGCVEHRDRSLAHRLTAAVEGVQDSEDDEVAHCDSRGEREDDGDQQEKRGHQ